MREIWSALKSVRGWIAALLLAFALAACGSAPESAAPVQPEPEPAAEWGAPPPAPPPPLEREDAYGESPPSIPKNGHSQGPASVPAEFRLPDFPWPPPRPSAQTLVPRADVLAGMPANPSLGAVGRRLSAALDEAGYSERSFYAVPGGFALVARLERIKPDGTPEPEQFRFAPPGAGEPFTLTTYIQQLFFAPEGLYRQIAFVVNDQAFVASGEALTAEEAQELLTEGANRLPPSFDRRPFSASHEVTALIYEFRKGPAERDVQTLVPGRLSARQHLQRAGIALR